MSDTAAAAAAKSNNIVKVINMAMTDVVNKALAEHEDRVVKRVVDAMKEQMSAVHAKYIVAAHALTAKTEAVSQTPHNGKTRGKNTVKAVASSAATKKNKIPTNGLGYARMMGGDPGFCAKYDGDGKIRELTVKENKDNKKFNDTEWFSRKYGGNIWLKADSKDAIRDERARYVNDVEAKERPSPLTAGTTDPTGNSPTTSTANATPAVAAAGTTVEPDGVVTADDLDLSEFDVE